MNTILMHMFDPSTCLRLTETLLHFLWEGLLIGVSAACFAWLCRNSSAHIRYGVHVASLALMALCVPVTFCLIDGRMPAVPNVPPALESSTGPSIASGISIEPSEDASMPFVAAPRADLDIVVLQALPPSAAEVPLPIAHQAGAAGVEIEPVSEPARVTSTLELWLVWGSPYAVCVYLSGVIFMLGRLALGLWGVRRLKRAARPVRTGRLADQIRQTAARIGLKMVPVVAFCERITIPVVAGVLRPVILLPNCLEAEFEPEQLLIILAHEMAHIRRLDLVVNLLQRLVETALFFHPAVWHVSRQLAAERENCCDDAVVRSGIEKVQYASILLRVAELCAVACRGNQAAPRASLALTGSSGSQLERRILRLLGAAERARPNRADSLALILLVALIVGATATARNHVAAAVAPPSDAKEVVESDDAIAETNGEANVRDNEQSEQKLESPKRADSASDGSDPTIALVLNADSKPESAKTDAEEVEFGGKVVDPDGKLVAGAEIWYAVAQDDTQDPARRGTVRQVAKSDEQGRFSFRLKPIPRAGFDGVKWMYSLSRVTAKASGFGSDSLPLVVFAQGPIPAEDRDRFQQEIDESWGAGRFSGQTLKLPPEAKPVRGRLVNSEGRPLEDVTVSIESIDNPDWTLLSQAFEKSSKNQAIHALQAHSGSGGWIGPHEWRVLFPPVKTNENGEFSLSGLGRDQVATVTLSREGVTAELFYIMGREMESRKLPHVEFYPNGAQDVFVGTRFTYAAGPAISVSGTVTEFQSGQPIANATVFVERLFRKEGMDGPVQLRMNTSHIHAVTDEKGHYRLVGIPPGKGHVLRVVPPKSEPWLQGSNVISPEASQPELMANIKVFRGIWLEGKATDATTGQPLSGHVDYLALQKNPNIPQRFGVEDGWNMERFPIDDSGHYRTVGLPGPGLLLVRSFGKTVYPRSVGAEKIDGYDAKLNYIPTTPIGLPLSNWHRVQLIDPPVDAKSFELDLALSAGASVTGRVVLPDGMPATNIEALGLIDKSHFFEKLNANEFTIHNYDPATERDLFFKAAENTLVGYLHLEGAPPPDLRVALEPAVTIRGRLIETETGEEAVGYHPYCESTSDGYFRVDDQATTDENGRFEIKGLMAGKAYKMDASNQQRFSNRKNRFTIDLKSAKPGDVIELGDVTGKNAKPKLKSTDQSKATDRNPGEVAFGGKVVDSDGKPVAEAEIWYAAWTPGVENGGSRGTARQVAKSDEQGSFSFRLKPQADAAFDAPRWMYQVAHVTARAPGFGSDSLPLIVFAQDSVPSEDRERYQREFDKRQGAGRFANRTLKLPPAVGPVQGRLMDGEGRPLKDVTVTVGNVQSPDGSLLSEAFGKQSRKLFTQALRGSYSGGWDVLFPPMKTNENGEFSLSGLGRDQMATVTLARDGVAADRFFILGRDMEPQKLPQLEVYPNGSQDIFVGTRFTYVAGPAIPVSGVVTEFQSGKPIANVTIYVESLFRGEGEGRAKRPRLHTDHIRAITDEQGRYRLVGIPPGKGHELKVLPPKSEPWLLAAPTISLEPSQVESTLDIQIFRGIWIEGQVTDAQTGERITGTVGYLALPNNPNTPQKFGLDTGWLPAGSRIDESGRYRTAGLPGPGVLHVQSAGRTIYPLDVGAEKVDSYDPKQVNFLPTSPVNLPLRNYHRIQQIDAPADAHTFAVDLTLSAGTSVTGHVVPPEGVPVTRIEVQGLINKDLRFQELKGNAFTINNYDPATARNLFFRTVDKSLVGYLHLEGAPPTDPNVTLQPAVTVRGRVVETETGDEAARYELFCESTSRGRFHFGKNPTTDESGRFEIKGLMAGIKYAVVTSNEQRTRQYAFTIDLTDAKPGDVVELGDVTGKKTKPNAQSGEQAKATERNPGEVEYAGTVVDAEGKPVAGAEILFAAAPDDHRNPRERGTVRRVATSDPAGKFAFRLVPVATGALDAMDWSCLVARVAAKAPGYGINSLPLIVFEQGAVPSERRERFRQMIDKGADAGRFDGQTLKLPPEAGPVRGRLVDLEGRPLANVVVSVQNIQNPDWTLLNQAFEKSSADLVLQALNAHADSRGEIGRELCHVLMPPVMTNAGGDFSLPGLGRDQVATVILARDGVAAERFFILGREMETKTLPHLSSYPQGAQNTYAGMRFTHAVGPAIPVSGVVTEFQSGKPIANATVFVERLFSREGMDSATRLRLDADHISAITDEEGRYRLAGIPPGEAHVLHVTAPKAEPWLIAAQKFSLKPDEPNATVNVQVFRGIWIEGRVTDAATGEGIAGWVDYMALQKNTNTPQQFGLEEGWGILRFPIDESGRYRVRGLPGPGVLLVRSSGTKVYPLSVGADKVEGYDRETNFLPLMPVSLPLSNWHRVEGINPSVDSQSFTRDLTLAAGAAVTGRVLEQNGTRASRIAMYGAVPKKGFFEDLTDDRFTVHEYEPNVPRDLFFKTEDNTLVGHLRLEGTPPEGLVVTLQLAVTVRGRLIETETGEEAVGYDIHCKSSAKGEFRIDDNTIADENGRFEIKGLLAGNVYKMDASNQQRFVSQKNGFRIDLTNAKPGDVIELGDVTGKGAK